MALTEPAVTWQNLRGGVRGACGRCGERPPSSDAPVSSHARFGIRAEHDVVRRRHRLGATLVGVSFTEGLDHYAMAMRDPEGNEFDIN